MLNLNIIVSTNLLCLALFYIVDIETSVLAQPSFGGNIIYIYIYIYIAQYNFVDTYYDDIQKKKYTRGIM